ncbi:MlaD family protein [Nocardia sp. CA-136227]|uniref:MlaD family protein n=1 Tax=Nocardia sp. CA-136227 TaxID=3239979 RepID=UPI003D97F0CD
MSRATGRIKPASIASLGALLAVLVLGIAYLTFGVLRAEPFAHYTTARLLVHGSGGVNPGTPVLLTGIRVGRVTEVSREADGVRIELRISGDHRIPAASDIRIENLSALGEPYIEFRPTDDRGPYLSDGQVLDTRKLAAPVLIPELSVRAVEFVAQLDPARISSLTATLDRALRGTEAQMPRLQRATTLLAATILSRTDTFRQLLTDLQTMGADMDWTGPTLATSGPYWSQFGTRIDQLINDASTLFEVGDAPHDYLNGDGVVPVLNRLADLMTRLGPDMAELAPILAPLTAEATPVLGRLDIGALISQAVNSVGAEGAIHLRVDLK